MNFATLLPLLTSLASLSLAQDERPNILFIAVDDLRPELKCFGADYIQSPHIDRLAAKGVSFHRHYVQAPTCGASRYALLTGQYGSYGNDTLFKRANKMKEEKISPTLPAWFREHGYTAVSVGKVSHHPGGRGGKTWDDERLLETPESWDQHLMPCGPWKTPVGAMHGLARGEVRGDPGKMDLYQTVAGGDDLYPDGLIEAESSRQLTTLAKAQKPFFLAVGFIRPHLPFGAPQKYLDRYQSVTLPAIPHPEKPAGKTTWHGSGEFMRYNRWGKNPNQDPEFATEVRRHYAACVSYADEQVGKLLATLEATGEAENTIIVLWGDHGWHLGEHALWGKHALFEESLRSPLIIVAPELKGESRQSEAIVETIDLYPTLCELAGLSLPKELDGESLLLDMRGEEKEGEAGTAISYTAKARTIRDQTHRLIVHRDGFCELYDHRSQAGETVNLAENFPEIVSFLKAQLAGE